jgi:hypothetical protein
MALVPEVWFRQHGYYNCGNRLVLCRHLCWRMTYLKFRWKVFANFFCLFSKTGGNVMISAYLDWIWLIFVRKKCNFLCTNFWLLSQSRKYFWPIFLTDIFLLIITLTPSKKSHILGNWWDIKTFKKLQQRSKGSMSSVADLSPSFKPNFFCSKMYFFYFSACLMPNVCALCYPH